MACEGLTAMTDRDIQTIKTGNGVREWHVKVVHARRRKFWRHPACSILYLHGAAFQRMLRPVDEGKR